MISKNKIDKKKNIIIPESNLINDFSIINFSDSISSGSGLFKYKFIIIWLPLLLYIIIMIISIININTINIEDQTNSFFSEFTLAFISGITMFCCYFIIDFLYQNTNCSQSNLIKLFINSIQNAGFIGMMTLFGYLVGLLFHNPSFEKATGSSSYMFNYNQWSINLSNHKNNLLLSFIFYIYGICYVNPLQTQKTSYKYSRNLMC